MEIIVIIALVLGAWLFLSARATKKRREALMLKYGDAEIVARIMSKSFWQGQSREQLIDSLGKPLDIDQKVLKTKTKETWKYHSRGKNRYGLRVVIENGIVVGWDQK